VGVNSLIKDMQLNTTDRRLYVGTANSTIDTLFWTGYHLCASVAGGSSGTVAHCCITQLVRGCHTQSSPGGYHG
jgi:hypothetical protein